MIRSILDLIRQWFSRLRIDLRWIVGQVQEERDTLHTAVFFEISGEESTRLHVHTHSCEHNREVLLVSIMYALCGLLDETGLTTNLGCNFVMRKTGSGEDRDLLSTSDGVHCVDRRNTSCNHFLGVDLSECQLEAFMRSIGDISDPGIRIDWTAVDIEVVFGEDLGAFINRSTRSIEDSPQHILRNTDLQAMAGELDSRLNTCQPLLGCIVLSSHTFLTSIPDVPSKTLQIVNNRRLE
jgi:hypothetical protein